MADQAEVHCLFGPERLAQKQIACRRPTPGEARQDQRARRLRHQAQVHEGHQEARAFLGDDEIAVEQHGRADPNGVAVHCGDHGHLILREGAKKPPDRNVRSVARQLGHEVAEVVPGREVLAFAAKRDQTKRIVLRSRFECVRKRGVHGNGDGVAPIRTRQRDRQHVAFAFQLYVLAQRLLPDAVRIG